jgi:hypothetical protein
MPGDDGRPEPMTKEPQRSCTGSAMDEGSAHRCPLVQREDPVRGGSHTAISCLACCLARWAGVHPPQYTQNAGSSSDRSMR